MVPDISPRTRVGDLLGDPALEEALLALSPAFAKLRNPVLRRTVARVATLRQAAEIAGLEVGVLVAALRRAAGQGPADPGAPAAGGAASASGPRPDWVLRAAIAGQVDAEQSLQRGDNPLVEVQRSLKTLAPHQAVLITASFKPAPLLELLQAQGHRVYCAREADQTWRCWVAR